MATKMDTDPLRLNLTGCSMADHINLPTVNRVARLHVGHETGLARMHRISNGGTELSSVIDLRIGQLIRLDLSETVSTTATVVLKDGKRYIVAFSQTVNCAELLRQLVQEARSTQSRPLRLKTPLMRVEGQSLAGSHELELENISQQGMKVRHDGSFQPGLRVWIQLPNGIERRGVVRWADERSAGLLLADILSADDLGAVSRLQFSRDEGCS
jgi:PilZ domain.